MDKFYSLKEQFIQQTFSKEWNIKLKNGDFEDADLINYCLEKAWQDAIIYVKKKHTQDDQRILNNQDKIRKKLLNDIHNCAWGQSFDDWHNILCINTDDGMCYGVWQKFINMSFKYLYCVNDKLQGRIDLDFSKCHLPLDDNTLLWCKKKGITEVKAWNRITQGEYEKIRDGIKTELEGQDMNALQLDFVVWRIKKICDVLKSIKNLNDDLSGLDNYHEWFADCGYNITDDKESQAVIGEMESLKSYIQQRQ